MSIRPITRRPVPMFPKAPPDPDKFPAWANAVTDTLNNAISQTAETFTPRSQFVKKPTNQVRTNTAVLAPDADLTVQLVANSIYNIEGHVFYDSSSTADFQFTFNGPAGATLIRIFHEVEAPGAAGFSNIGVDAAYGVVQAVPEPGTQGGYIYFHALIQNGANAGLFTFDWAQNTAHALTNTFVFAGSHLTFHQL
jgi:hypothetical protein